MSKKTQKYHQVLTANSKETTKTAIGATTLERAKIASQTTMVCLCPFPTASIPSAEEDTFLRCSCWLKDDGRTA